MQAPSPRVLVALSLLPIGLVLRGLAFAAPGLVEALFAERWYPLVAGALGAINRLLPVPVAEVGAVLGLLLAAGVIWRWWQRGRRAGRRPLESLAASALALWAVAGAVLLLFLFAWGFHYARAPLRDRLMLDLAEIEADEVLVLAQRFVDETNSAYDALGANPESPTVMVAEVTHLDALLDAAYQGLDLPGDAIRFTTSPAKGLISSALFARLGISGIFIPFTGEPLFNQGVPDVSLPVAIAHEKAHHRGITDEGEANLAAVLACLSTEDPYLRYAAALYSSSALLGSANRYAPDRVQEIASAWGPGPRRDLAAIREFWDRYRGPTMRAAGRVNDAYLRSNRVEGGVQSYGRVVSMLVGLERAGRLPGVPD